MFDTYNIYSESGFFKTKISGFCNEKLIDIKLLSYPMSLCYERMKITYN